jgi:hypothetical protein
LGQKTKIYLLDFQNNVLFDERKIGNTKYERFFDFSNLADGEYTFVVELGKDKIKKEFAIRTKTLRGVSLANN